MMVLICEGCYCNRQWADSSLKTPFLTCLPCPRCLGFGNTSAGVCPSPWCPSIKDFIQAGGTGEVMQGWLVDTELCVVIVHQCLSKLVHRYLGHICIYVINISGRSCSWTLQI